MENFFSPGAIPPLQTLQSATDQINLAYGDLKSHLKGLNNEERRFMRKMGNQRFAYAKKAVSFGKIHEDVLPRKFNIQDFENLMNFYEQLGEVYRNLSKLQEGLDDTLMAIGIDAMAFTKMTHDAFRAQAKSGLYDDVLDMLDEFNAKSQKEDEGAKSKTAANATPTETANEKEVNS